MANIINLHEEALYLQGARQLLLMLEHQNAIPQWHKEKDGAVYNQSIFRELLYNRDSLQKFLEGNGWTYSEHQKDKKGKLINVKTTIG